MIWRVAGLALDRRTPRQAAYAAAACLGPHDCPATLRVDGEGGTYAFTVTWVAGEKQTLAPELALTP